MMNYRFIFMLCLLIWGNSSLFAQLTRADEYFANFNYPEAIDAYERAYKKGNSKEKYIAGRLAESYRLIADFENAEKWYAEVVKDQQTEPVNYYYYGKMLESNRKFAEAREWFMKYAEKLPQDSRAENYKDYSPEKIAEILEDKGNYQVTAVSVNTEYDEFSPVYFGQKLVFASNRPSDLLVSRKHNWNALPFIDLYVSDIQDDQDLMDVNNFAEFNQNWHEGPVSFTSDLKRIYFTRNASRGNNLLKGMNSTVHLMIYTARKVTLSSGEEKWTEAEALDFNSVEYSCQHPSISEDGQKLYFASDQPGGYGGMDIYVSEKTILGWSKPRNLGRRINSSGDEAFPFIARDGNLYFASKGLLGAGGFDIFVASPNGNSFNKPVNLGYPVNDVRDDFGLVLDHKGEQGYFSSNRVPGSGRDDIYRVKVLNLPERNWEEDTVEEEPAVIAALPRTNDKLVAPTVLPDISLSQMLVFVYDKISGVGLEDAVVNVFTPQGKLVDAVQVNKEGYAALNRQDYQGNLRFIASYPEYTSYREVVNMDNLPAKNAVVRLPLNKDLGKITSLEGKSFKINPIYFDYDKDNIRPDAARELDKVVAIMNDHPEMIIEVASHTDSRGNNQYNYDLSQRRARSSREYIMARGISPNRIQGRGYGESQLTNQCEDGVNCTEGEHQMNRRTEFRIVKM